MTWDTPTCNWSAIGATQGLNSILNTDLLPNKSKFPNSGGKTVSRLAWMCNSRNLGKKPISLGMSIKSFSRKTNWKIKKN